jgi:hypothetical protein
MTNTAERYQEDLDRLIRQGGKLVLSLQRSAQPDAETKTDLPEDELKNLPDFNLNYQAWYSESLAVISQLIPERVSDFQAYYAPKGPRKKILFSNYTISDALRGTTVRQYGDIIAGPASAIGPLYQQYNIVTGLRNRFASKLYDIKNLVHADLLDDELHAAEELNARGFQRGAGAIAGVVLESHLAAVSKRHGITLCKKDPTISDLNDALKNASVTEISTWRFIQHLGDLRNKCDHKKSTDPTKDDAGELIEGVRRITKTVL